MKKVLCASARRVVIAAGVALFGLWAAQAQPRDLGDALFARGCNRTLIIMAPDGVNHLTQYRIKPPFDPSVPYSPVDAALLFGRYGLPARGVFAAGALEGGRIKDPTPELLSILGLPQGYQWTAADRMDASIVTCNGTTWACDDQLLVPVDDTPPPPAGCEPPKVCALPCPACPVCPTCPPPSSPPAMCAPMPDFVRRTIEKGKRFTSPRAWDAVQAWAATCPR